MSEEKSIGEVTRASHLEKQGALKAVIAEYQQMCQKSPRQREGWIGLARTYASIGDLQRACWALEQWLNLQSQDAEAWERLGRLHTVMHSYELAETCLRRSLKIDPKRHHAKQSLLFALKQLGQTGALDETAELMLRQEPHHLPSLIAQALSLPPVYSDQADLIRWRQRYMDGLERLAGLDPQQLAKFNNIAELEWTNFYLAYQGEDDRLAQMSYSRFLQGVLTASDVPQLKAGECVSGHPRIRVGFLSSFFRTSTVGKYFSSWITDLPRDRFDVYVYFIGAHRDALTNELALNCSRFRHLRDGLVATARQVLADRLDILIYPEVGMEGLTLLLSNLRLAPIQMAAWGHPVTTGSIAIDYFLSCTDMEPENGSEHYSESLITLAGLGTRYTCPQTTSHITRAQLGLAADQNIYLIPQSLYKLLPDNDDIYIQILKRDSNAVLVFFAALSRPLLNLFTQRLQRALDKHKIEARSQIKFLPRLSWDQYIAVNKIADVMLDSLHWSGGQTSLDALGSDLPVVTLPGRFMRGRQTQAMLNIIGVPELIVKSKDDYIELAIEVASNKRYNQQLKKRLAEGKSKLFDQQQATTELGNILENLHTKRSHHLKNL